jgi:hypothetical protein
MRRTGIIAAAVLLIVASIAVPASASDHRAVRDDNATVCAATAKTLQDGLNKFSATMSDVSQRASKGDLAGAETQVKAAGADLVALGASVHQQAAKADDANLKTAANDLGTELDKLGTALNSLTALQSFDTTNLETAARKLSTICGVQVLPSEVSTSPAAPPSTPGTPAPAPATPAPAPSATV